MAISKKDTITSDRDVRVLDKDLPALLRKLKREYQRYLARLAGMKGR